MAPRANWKGFLRLSLVTCPVALYPATSDSEKISFNQINRATGHRKKKKVLNSAHNRTLAGTGMHRSDDSLANSLKAILFKRLLKEMKVA
jgi:non-homologous end joining protein Ku